MLKAASSNGRCFFVVISFRLQFLKYYDRINYIFILFYYWLSLRKVLWKFLAAGDLLKREEYYKIHIIGKIRTSMNVAIVAST